MSANISVIYGGDAAEANALDITAMLAGGLDARAECRLLRDPLSLLSADQRNDYRNLIELSGWTQAHEFLVRTAKPNQAEAAAQVAQRFRALPASKQVAWGVPFDPAANLERELIKLGYTRDMLVASFALSEGLRDTLTKRVLLGVGAPLLFAAHSPHAAEIEKATIVMAWKPSAAAKHALRYALPMLRKAGTVHLVAIEEDGEPPMHPSAQAIADYLLEVHNVSVQAIGLRAADTPALQLAEYYREMKADLLVMGAYSMPRLQEIFFGGFTKYFFAKQQCNLLLAH